MKYKQLAIICSLLSMLLMACDSEFFTPVGFKFTLMKNTPVWALAQAVKQEDVDEIKRLIQEEKVNVNYQEHQSRIHTTLLHLAVANDKLLSVKALLDNGAQQNISDAMDQYPIHYILLKEYSYKHRLEILRLLLNYGADPNPQTKPIYKNDTIPHYGRPLMLYAVDNLECTKLLLEYGADINYKNSDETGWSYPIWLHVFRWDDLHDNDNNKVFVAKYLIVDKHLPIPDTLSVTRRPGEQGFYFTALQCINEATLKNPDKKAAKEEILAYLNKIGFPKQGVLKDESKLFVRDFIYKNPFVVR